MHFGSHDEPNASSSAGERPRRPPPIRSGDRHRTIDDMSRGGVQKPRRRRGIVIGTGLLLAIGVGTVAVVVANSTRDEAQPPVVSGPSREITPSMNTPAGPPADRTQGMTPAQLQNKPVCPFRGARSGVKCITCTTSPTGTYFRTRESPSSPRDASRASTQGRQSGPQCARRAYRFPTRRRSCFGSRPSAWDVMTRVASSIRASSTGWPGW
jgi:hypothetical protein